MTDRQLRNIIREEIEGILSSIDEKEEYTVEDAYKALNPPSFQFILAGAKPVRGYKYKGMPSYFELNQSRENRVSVRKIGEHDFRIIIPLLGRTTNECGLSIRPGDSFTLEIYDVSDKEAVEIAKILSNNIKYDAMKIQRHDLEEGKEVLTYVAKNLPNKMNKETK